MRRAAAAARILAARVVRSSPTEYGPPGFASTSTAPNSSACSAARAGRLRQRTDHHRRQRMEVHQLLQERQPVHARHLDVQREHVRLQAPESCRARRRDRAPCPRLPCPPRRPVPRSGSCGRWPNRRRSGREFSLWGMPVFPFECDAISTPVAISTAWTRASGNAAGRWRSRLRAMPAASARRNVVAALHAAQHRTADHVGQFADHVAQPACSESSASSPQKIGGDGARRRRCQAAA